MAHMESDRGKMRKTPNQSLSHLLTRFLGCVIKPPYYERSATITSLPQPGGK